MAGHTTQQTNIDTGLNKLTSNALIDTQVSLPGVEDLSRLSPNSEAFNSIQSVKGALGHAGADRVSVYVKQDGANFTAELFAESTKGMHSSMSKIIGNPEAPYVGNGTTAESAIANAAAELNRDYSRVSAVAVVNTANPDGTTSQFGVEVELPAEINELIQGMGQELRNQGVERVEVRPVGAEIRAENTSSYDVAFLDKEGNPVAPPNDPDKTGGIYNGSAELSPDYDAGIAAIENALNRAFVDYTGGDPQ